MKISATLKSIEDKTTTKEDEEVHIWTAVFEFGDVKARISQDTPFKDLVIGQVHDITVKCPQTKIS